MKSIVSRLLASLLMVSTLPSWAQESSDAREARASYEEGAKHYDLAEYAEALASFKDAYRTKYDPAFLFNIAQCLRKLNRLDEAANFYRSYLRRAPDADNREKVERHIKDIEDQMAAASPPATPNQDPSPKQFSAHDIPIVPAPRIDLAPQPPSAIKDRPIYERWWFWTAAGAVAAGTTATIIILARHDPTSIPASALGTQRALP